MRIDKDNIKIILILLVVCLSLGYAYINSDLNINGTAQVKHANWDVHWANVQVKTGSVSASTPTISNQTTVTYSVTLTNPGDYYEFTVDAVNGGQMDAMIDAIDSKLNNNPITTLPAYLNYSVTYSDGIELEPNHELLANTTETYKVRLEYRTDIELNQLPTINQNLTLSFTVTYRQINDSAIERSKKIYTANLYDVEGTVQIGQTLANGIIQYSSATDALAALRLATSDNNIQFYLKHTVSGGIVTESYIEFIVTPGMASANSGMHPGTYVIRGFDTYDENAINTNWCKEEYYDFTNYTCINPFYESNKQVLLSAFGSSNCTVYSSDIDCSVTNLSVNADGRGAASAYDGIWICSISYSGESQCSPW